MKTKYQIGWIGLRAKRTGKAAKILKLDGWMRQDHADAGNRNGFDWVRPSVTVDTFAEMDFFPYARAGLRGLAVWITDAQWGANAGITDAQWAARRAIE